MFNKIYTSRLVVIAVFFLLMVYTASAQTKADTDTVSARFRSFILSTSVPTDATVKPYLDSLQPDGSWKDVNYADKSATVWLPLVHLNRLLSICISYHNKKSVYYHSANVKAQIYTSFTYWNGRGSYSTNWYQNDIAWPTVYGKSLLTMKSGDAYGFSKDTLYALADTGLNYYDVSAAIYSPTVSESILGANKTLNLEVSIYKACIKDSTDELRRNFDTAFASIVVFPGTGLGMKVDNSYYQHGPQLYNWGYGTAFLGGVTYFAYYARNTGFATTQSNIKILIDYVLDGQQWMQQKNAADFNAIGRSISRSGSLTVSWIRNNCLIYLINLKTGYRTTELNNYYKFANGGNVTFQSPGIKQFYKTDYMVQHGANFLLSVKTPSKRTIGTESLNNENLKAKYLSWGSTNIMVNGDEYTNAVPVWDWTRIPGTTTANDPNANFTKMPSSGFRTTTSIAGGVTNGVYGLSADAFTWDSVSGKKAYFFTPNGMYCMGAAIKSTKVGRNIVTSVNQCMSSGTVTVDSAGSQSVFTGQQVTSSNVTWVHHNNVGYLFPNNGKITIANQIQTGSWYSINLAQSRTAVSNTIFSLWVNHDTLPKAATYEYIVAPYKSVSGFASWASNCPLKKIANNSGFQAFYDDSAKVYAVAFYGAAGVMLDTANNFYIRSNKPALLLIAKQTNGYAISVAEPTQLLDSLGLTISSKLAGANAIINGDSTFISVQLPTGDTVGKTVTNAYTLYNPLPIHFVAIKANYANEQAIINWEVVGDDALKLFEVERSIDGINFFKIGEQATNLTTTSSYSFVDTKPSLVNFYRIRSVDALGSGTYSNVVKLATSNAKRTTCSVYPNPLKGKVINLQLTGFVAGKYTVGVYNVLGQKLHEAAILHTGGNTDFSINLNNSLPIGSYYIAVRNEENKLLICHTALSVLP